MSAASPTVFSIPPGESFVDALARGLLEETSKDPLALSGMLILLPTRRACRALREAFLRRSGGRPLLLPRMRPLGDADEEELEITDGRSLELVPAVPPLRRQLLLAQLVLKLGGGRGGQTPSPEQAVRLAGELGRLLDQVHTEGLTFEGLEKLVRDDYAEHWQITLDFLKIVTHHWPTIVESQGWMDGALRRNQLIETQSAAWETQPPDYPIIAAGSTGSIPATARMLSVVSRLPQGRLVLPGLDVSLDGSELEQSHPQYGLQQLLTGLGLTPAQVPQWPGCSLSPRAWLISEAMRPARTTERWRRLSPTPAQVSQALDGVNRIDCPGPREEAGAIALMMREALEHDSMTAALVTPDRSLARRVAAELRRFDIEIDDSAGRPLDITPVGAFLLLTAEMLADDCAPHALLSALKHPLALGGLPSGRFRALVRKLEREVLRGPRPGPGVAGLKAAAKEEMLSWLNGLEHMTKPLAVLMAGEAALSDLIHAHVNFVEALAADEGGDGAALLWRGEAGEAASLFLRDLADAADALPAVEGRGYPGILRGLMAGVTVRPRWGGHPRLSIWGPLEARMQHADLLVLGGLNEGTWPAETTADPWMSRPMRQDFGLPLPERRIGLSAHDFAQAFCAPKLVMTRSLRVDGTPTVPSRWLLRLDAVLQACGHEHYWHEEQWVRWHGRLDQPDGAPTPISPPAPRPPLEARPRALFATAIEGWMRDPYSVYAKYILKLRPLDPIDADPGAADYGDVVHKTLDAFLKKHPRGPLPLHALDELMALGEAQFAPLLESRPGLAAFWWPRFQRVAQWFVAFEQSRRPEVAEVQSEVEGSLEIAAPGGPFLVQARADRVDLMQDGSLVLIDYKTGAPPTAREVAAGYAPQLPIEAVIASHGGFKDIPAKKVSQLLYWRLKGGEAGGEERSAGDDTALLTEQALDGLAGLVAAFDREETPYEARPHPDMAPKYSDYLHLARVKEWASSAEEGEE